ncbi:MAG: hypothetical protein ACYTAF_13290, partial [Planctomycetota bacterium]
MRTSILLIGLLVAGCYATPVEPDPYGVPLDRVRAERRDTVRKILREDPVEVAIGEVEVRSTLELYEFLMDELPFTASILRARGEAKYDLFREAPRPGEGPEGRERRRSTYYLNDKEGMQMALELVYHERGKWIYYMWGTYSFLFTFRGTAVVVVTAEPEGDVLRTRGRAYIPFPEKAGALVEGVVRRKSAVFIDASRSVAELAADDPEDLIRSVEGAEQVDKQLLEEFKERF